MMYQSSIRNIVASIIVFGHILVFVGGFFFLGIFGPLYSEDTLQVIFMASPVLAVSSVAAVKYVTGNSTNHMRGKKVTTISAAFSIGIPIILLLVISGLFVTMYLDGDRFGPNELKIALGVVETFFGIFISLITESLFPKSD